MNFTWKQYLYEKRIFEDSLAVYVVLALLFKILKFALEVITDFKTQILKFGNNTNAVTSFPNYSRLYIKRYVKYKITT